MRRARRAKGLGDASKKKVRNRNEVCISGSLCRVHPRSGYRVMATGLGPQRLRRDRLRNSFVSELFAKNTLVLSHPIGNMVETEVDSETELKDIEDSLQCLAETDLRSAEVAQKLLDSTEE